MNMTSILNEFNESNSLNHKRSVCKKYKDNKLFTEVFMKTYDRVKWTWNISLKNIPEYTSEKDLGISYALKEIERLHNREVTGNSAITFLTEILSSLNSDDADVIEKVIKRDLRINFGKREYNKIVADEYKCLSPVYMRCGIYSPKTAKDIKFPAFIQLKADGTYREACVSNGKIEFISRSGESYVYPILEKHLANSPDGYYTGELLVRNAINRSISNGAINSDNPPHEIIDFHVWDYITPEEYSNAHNKKPNSIKYVDRLKKLSEIISDLNSTNIHMIENHEVNTLDEALEITSNWMEQDLEGGVLKDKNGLFKNGTSKHQLKLKLEIDVDVRVTGFQEGTPGTSREKTFGAILFETDDKNIKGKTSGFTDDQLEKFNNMRNEMIGKIITVRCNDVTKGRSNDHYALSHPRFIEMRNDKHETDTLERALETKDMAKGLSI